ncbi:MAG: hypothetical protein ACW967_05180 [Candidatus Hodarchaeales archaeon]|jgi:hypothetical protein
MNKFVRYCISLNPDLDNQLKDFFHRQSLSRLGPCEFTIGFYLFYNYKELFPNCKKVLLYEKELILNRTDKGKLDFAFLTHDNKILLIETKFINHEESGKTAKNRRNKKRQKVIDQVKRWKNVLMNSYLVPSEEILCGVFTTDLRTVRRAEQAQILGNYVSIPKLRKWLTTRSFPQISLSG